MRHLIRRIIIYADTLIRHYVYDAAFITPLAIVQLIRCINSTPLRG